mmetsp:Transcript_77915/g.95422  ORF Transcript_77915/g.95422 Transcript_77915/m.95422 type:complete len:119 (-) Transcript_77915:303-659(-)
MNIGLSLFSVAINSMFISVKSQNNNNFETYTDTSSNNDKKFTKTPGFTLIIVFSIAIVFNILVYLFYKYKQRIKSQKNQENMSDNIARNKAQNNAKMDVNIKINNDTNIEDGKSTKAT